MATRAPIIDSQVHSYERDRLERPWAGYLHGPDEATGDQMVEAMDAVGVDGALLVSPYSMYRYDPSYAIEVYAKHPTRFGLIKPFDPHSDAIEEEVAEWGRTPGVAGARLILTHDPYDADAPGIDRLIDAVARAGLPLNVLAWGRLPAFHSIARRHPDTQLALDHIGLLQPYEPPAPPEPFAALPDVIALAEFDHVAIKISGACVLSHQPFPYPDIWEPLRRIFDAFGIERCMWGTDWTRTISFLNYRQAVDAFRVTDELSDGGARGADGRFTLEDLQLVSRRKRLGRRVASPRRHRSPGGGAGAAGRGTSPQPRQPM